MAVDVNGWLLWVSYVSSVTDVGCMSDFSVWLSFEQMIYLRNNKALLTVDSLICICGECVSGGLSSKCISV